MTDNTKIILSEEKDSKVREELINVLWALATTNLAIKGNENTVISIKKDLKEEYEKLPLEFICEPDNFIIKKPSLSEKERIKFNETILYDWPSLYDVSWFDIKKKIPPEEIYVIGILYNDCPATIVRQNNIYMMHIPPGTTKDRKDIFVEVTKGVKYWTFLPNPNFKEVKKFKHGRK